MKLLSRTLRTYLLYSALVMLISTPVFYGVIEQLFTEEIDEVLWLRKEAIQNHLSRFSDEQSLLAWRDLEGNTRLEAIRAGTPIPRRDRIIDRHYREHPNDPQSQPEPFRELHATVTFQNASYLLVTRTSLVEKDALLRAVVVVQTGLLILLLVGLLLLNRQTARRLWHPFYQTLNRLRHYRVEQAEPFVLTPSTTTEFAELNQTLAELTRRSHQAYAVQKEFTENAAHEMQTPVAVLQTRLERLTQTQPLTRDQSELIGSLNGVTSRLSRLNKSLLLLARVDNQPDTHVESVFVSDVLNGLISQSVETMQAKSIALTRTGFTHGPTLATNRMLLEIMLANLLTNAVRYTAPGGHITVQLQHQSLRITNTGEPLSISADRLFARFQKGEAQTGGVGLGLAIAKKIANTHGYTMNYHYADGQHQFVIWFG